MQLTRYHISALRPHVDPFSYRCADCNLFCKGRTCNHCGSPRVEKFPRKVKQDPVSFDDIMDALKRAGLLATDIQIEVSAC
jgi:hypothetical protein